MCLRVHVHPCTVCVECEYLSGVCVCNLLPGNQILISSYLSIRKEVETELWSNGSGSL